MPAGFGVQLSRRSGTLLRRRSSAASTRTPGRRFSRFSTLARTLGPNSDALRQALARSGAERPRSALGRRRPTRSHRSGRHIFLREARKKQAQQQAQQQQAQSRTGAGVHRSVAGRGHVGCHARRVGQRGRSQQCGARARPFRASCREPEPRQLTCSWLRLCSRRLRPGDVRDGAGPVWARRRGAAVEHIGKDQRLSGCRCRPQRIDLPPAPSRESVCTAGRLCRRSHRPRMSWTCQAYLQSKRSAVNNVRHPDRGDQTDR